MHSSNDICIRNILYIYIYILYIYIYIYSQDYIDVQKSPSKKHPLQEHIQRLIAIRLQVAT